MIFQDLNQYEYLHWVLVCQTIEIKGNKFRQGKTFTPPELPQSQFKFLTPGEYINGTTFPVSQLEQGGALAPLKFQQKIY